jgi:hypothetical protein
MIDVLVLIIIVVINTIVITAPTTKIIRSYGGIIVTVTVFTIRKGRIVWLAVWRFMFAMTTEMVTGMMT